LVTPSIRLERLLGRGGMGSVWLAQHLQLRTQVVVKFMTAERAGNQESQQRFRREAELAAQAKSPHVVQIFDHGVSALGLPYIAMELLEGEDLGKRIAREGTIDPRRFADWLTQACRGVARAHAKGIVHRDIKPENIFLCENDGEVLVKVLDFGVAKGALDPSGLLATQTGAMLGTAYYMSPEQTMGKKDIDHRSDLWALGVVTFYALTGVRPFGGDGLGPLVLSITTDPLPLLSARNPAFGRELDSWMLKALARSREERFQSAKELAEAFAALVGALDLARSPSPAAAWPTGPVPPPVRDSSEARLAASTMSPSVSSEGSAPRATTLGSTVGHRLPTWMLTIGAGAAAGLVAVLLLLASHRPPEASPSAAASSAPMAPLPPPLPPSVEPVLAPSPVAPEPSTSASPAAVTTPPPRERITHKAVAAPSSAPILIAPAAAPPPQPPTPTPTKPANPLDMKIE